MTVNIDVDVETGPVSAIPVPVTTVDVPVINAPCCYYGFSLREASGDVPRDNEGSATSPAALQTIATITGLPAGNYTVNWTVSLAGTLAAADANNFELTDTNGVVSASINPAIAGEYPQVASEISIPANATVSIQAIAAGTVGAIYSAQLAIEPSIVDDAVIEVRDGNQILATCSLGVGGAETEYPGPPGIKVMASITVHVVQGTVTGVIYVMLGY